MVEGADLAVEEVDVRVVADAGVAVSAEDVERHVQPWALDGEVEVVGHHEGRRRRE